ncbi:MAG TPA: hypothetical protein PL188_02855 [Candidatus Cloacimonadota bacterium]|nr:hypothetical protein [Candidatus Cloacimonadota bacterium]
MERFQRQNTAVPYMCDSRNSYVAVRQYIQGILTTAHKHKKNLLCELASGGLLTSLSFTYITLNSFWTSAP